MPEELLLPGCLLMDEEQALLRHPSSPSSSIYLHKSFPESESDPLNYSHVLLKK